MLVNGKWSAEWHPVQATDKQGGFVRQTSSFRHWLSADGSSEFAAEPDRYHLYVALICPWDSRTLIARSLKGLEQIVSVSVVEPQLGAQGWRFGDYPGADRDQLNNTEYLHQLYTRADADFTGARPCRCCGIKKPRPLLTMSRRIFCACSTAVLAIWQTTGSISTLRICDRRSTR